MLAMLDLFSGIGGFSLGFERAGFQTVAFCECDPFCRNVLRKHWPHVPIYNDVRTLTNERLAADGITRIDIITAGFPCQPFSTAGKRQGQNDDRYLWPALLAVIHACRPEWIVIENVYGMVTIDEGMVFERMLSDMESEDYETGALVIPACAVNAPHRRYRVWIVAHGNDQRQLQPQGAFKKLRRWSGNEGEDVAYTNGRRLEKRQGQRGDDGAQQPPAFGSDRRVTLGALGRGADGIPPRMDGCIDYWPDGWEDGLPRTTRSEPFRAARLKALGNSIVPQIAELIARTIRSAAQGDGDDWKDSHL